MKNKFIAFRFISIQIFLILALSGLSIYQIPDLSEVDWQTVLFLTPYGIVSNFIHRQDSVMWSFYSDISSGQLDLSTGSKLGMAVIFILMIGNTWNWLSQESRK